ncbi:MAG: cobalamin biosynthesis protein CobW [Boseongicola sp. SB0664_bin_43]|uniref:Cobalamin biosynthesis protein CobW n=1 Tax=Boseongicola sp. SB0664_bin_43 TaxID=2604844 RepID=A0A6B0Y4I0_9RHOB|nr:cobalamin biosynthesis protein CobW [Boseongicola sp. SB0664_bin_43]
MNDLAKIPVTVVTGFLGAGKTTLIRHLIESSRGHRLAVIVNEFGDVGVDGEILRSCAIPDCPAENIVELANGCICCTVADDFIPTIGALLDLDPLPEHILIETSGLALPKPLLKAFDWPAIRSRVTVDGVVALADAEAVAAGRFAPDIDRVEAQRLADESIDHETPLAEVFEDQIACADIVLLTKPDLAGLEGVAQARTIVERESPRVVPVLEVQDGTVDAQVLLGIGAAAEDDLAARPSHHDGLPEHDHDDFDTIVVDVPEAESANDLVARVEALARHQNVLRVKGHVSVRGKPMRLLVQGVGTRVRHQFDRAWERGENRKGRLVVIAEHDDIDPEAIRSILVPEEPAQ